MLLVRASHSLNTAEALLRDQNIPHTPFQIATTTPQKLTLPPSAHLILTSTAAVPSIPTSGTYTLHCVHQTTADAITLHIKNTSHTLATIGTNNAQTLADTIRNTHTPPQLFHHLTTDGANTHWYSTLTQIGHAIQRHTAYTTDYANQLTPPAEDALRAQKPIILCSQKSAEHLLFLVSKANISLMNTTAYCLSPAIAHVCQNHVKTTKIATTPTLKSLIQTL